MAWPPRRRQRLQMQQQDAAPSAPMPSESSAGVSPREEALPATAPFVAAMWLLSSLAAALCTPPLRAQNTAAPLVSIAATQPSDLDAVLDLTMEVFFGVLGNDFGFNNNRAVAFDELTGLQRESLRSLLADASAVSFKATRGDDVVGFVVASGGGEVTNLVVAPSARRARVGQRLVTELVTASSAPALVLEVDQDNEAALGLYRACGFAVTSELPGTRYVVDWWRGRCIEKVGKVSMARERELGAADEAGGVKAVSYTHHRAHET